MRYDLPTAVEINGTEYQIRSDYRDILTIIEALSDAELSEEEKAEAMRTLYLPLSEIVVDEDRTTGEVVAFMAFVEDYLAALFVAPAHQKRGVGSRLLALAKKMRGTLDLSVYAENERAVAFYQKNGFRITGERIEEVTGRTELLMAFP